MNAVTEAALEASSEAAGRDNETSIEIAASQLFDEKARHARLACPGRPAAGNRTAGRGSIASRATESTKCARRMRCASETEREQAAIETRGTAGSDDFEALLVVPVEQTRARQRRSVLYMSASDAWEPYHGTLTTATSWSARTPLTATAGVKGFEPGSFALPGLSFCGNYPCEMLARLKTSLRTLENDQIKPLIKARIHDRAFE